MANRRSSAVSSLLIRRDIDVDFNLQDAAKREPDRELLAGLFSEFEFSSLLHQLKLKADAPVKECTMVTDGKSLSELASKLRLNDRIACEVIWEKTPPTAFIGMSFDTVADSFYLPLRHTSAKQQLTVKEVLDAMAPVFAEPQIKKYFYDLKQRLFAWIILS